MLREIFQFLLVSKKHIFSWNFNILQGWIIILTWAGVRLSLIIGTAERDGFLGTIPAFVGFGDVIADRVSHIDVSSDTSCDSCPTTL